MKNATAKVLRLLGIITILIALLSLTDFYQSLSDVPAVVANHLLLNTVLWFGVGITQIVLAVHLDRQERS